APGTARKRIRKRWQVGAPFSLLYTHLVLTQIDCAPPLGAGASNLGRRFMNQNPDITQLLEQAAEGDASALTALLPVVYEEMRRLAHRQLRTERRNHTLNTTALVHEAYLKLVKLERIRWQNRAQFFALAAQAMRR